MGASSAAVASCLSFVAFVQYLVSPTCLSLLFIYSSHQSILRSQTPTGQMLQLILASTIYNHNNNRWRRNPAAASDSAAATAGTERPVDSFDSNRPTDPNRRDRLDGAIALQRSVSRRSPGSAALGQRRRSAAARSRPGRSSRCAHHERRAPLGFGNVRLQRTGLCHRRHRNCRPQCRR